MTSRRTAISAFAICVQLAAIAGGQQDRISPQKEPQFSASYVPNHVGEWLHEKDYSSANIYRLTPADQSAFTATLEQVEAIFRATPMMNPPHGFNAFHASERAAFTFFSGNEFIGKRFHAFAGIGQFLPAGKPHRDDFFRIVLV